MRFCFGGSSKYNAHLPCISSNSFLLLCFTLILSFLSLSTPSSFSLSTKKKIFIAKESWSPHQLKTHVSSFPSFHLFIFPSLNFLNFAPKSLLSLLFLLRSLKKLDSRKNKVFNMQNNLNFFNFPFYFLFFLL